MDFKINYGINMNHDKFWWIIHVSVTTNETGRLAMSHVQSVSIWLTRNRTVTTDKLLIYTVVSSIYMDINYSGFNE